MVVQSFLFLFISVVLFCNFGQIASSGRLQSSSDIRSKESSRIKANLVTSSDIAPDNVVSEKLLKVADKEILISAKVKSENLKGNKVQIPISAKIRTGNLKRNTKKAQIPVSEKVKTRNMERKSNNAEIPIPISAKFKFGNSKGTANIKKDKLPVSAKVHTENSNDKAKKGRYEVNQEKELKSARQMRLDQKMERIKPVSSTVRASKNEPNNLKKKTVRAVKKNTENDLQTSYKFRNAKNADKKAHRSSHSFRLAAASTKFMKRFRFGSQRIRTRKVEKSKGGTIAKSSRTISKKAESARGKRIFESEKTLAGNVKTAKIERSKKKTAKSIREKKIYPAVRRVNTATTPIRQLTKLSASTVRADAVDDDDDLHDQKLHYEYTSEYPASCSCAVAKGMHTGICWYFLDSSKTSCKKRTCSKSYVCVVGETTNLTCMRKENTHRIVSNGDGSCRTEKTHSYQYIPYSS